MSETAEALSQETAIRQELARSTSQKGPGEKVKAETKDKYWFVTYVILLFACIICYYLVGSGLFSPSRAKVELVQRILRGATLIILVVALTKVVTVYVLGRIDDGVTRFTLRRIEHLLAGILIAVIALSVTFVNWYAGLTALGVGSIIIGLAVQTPLKSFIGWIFILVRQPYRVGDRIKVEEATGDVIDVSYLDTTLWEFGGQYISGDHPSGRIIKFPNSKILDSIVYNYSWPLFPYIWNEIKFQIAYNSNLEFVAKTMQAIAEKELGEEMIERVEVFRKLLARTPVNELEVHERPRVIFRVSDNTWLEAIVRYVVPPREAGHTKTRLIRKLLAALNAEPEKVMFPLGANR